MMPGKNFIPVLITTCLALQACLPAGGLSQGTVAILSPQNIGQGLSNVTEYSVGTDLTGTWSIYLLDSKSSRLDLALFQNRGVITGYGQMTFENTTQEVTAAGDLNGVGADLFISPIGSMTVYRLSLVPSEKTIKGSYNAYSTSGKTWSGAATGSSPAVQEVLSPAQSHYAARSANSSSSQVDAVNIGQGIVSGSQAYAGEKTVSSGGKGVTVGSTSVSTPDSTYNPQTGGLTISKIVSSTYDGTGTTTTTSDGSHTTITYS
jgi:hypothetical protein